MRHARLICIISAVLCTLLLISTGCEQQPATAPRASSPPRVVSLSPAITRSLVDLGLAAYIVGRTPWCTAVDESVPIVGDLYDLSYETLARLNPTHVLVQPPATGLAPELSAAAERSGFQLTLWMLNTIDDVEQMVLDIPRAIYPDDRDARSDVAAIAAQWTNDLAASLSPGSDGLFTQPVLLIAGADPPLAFGSDTYLHDILTRLGGANAVTASGWIELSMEDIARIDPAAIILLSDDDDDDAQAAHDPRARLGPIADINTRAAREGRLAVLSHRDALLPSTAAIELAQRLRDILISMENTARADGAL